PGAIAGECVAGGNPAARPGRLPPRLAELPGAAHFRHAAGRARSAGNRRPRAAAASRGAAHPSTAAGLRNAAAVPQARIFSPPAYGLKSLALRRNNSAKNSARTGGATAGDSNISDILATIYLRKG